jgi:hypothetical protein
MIPRAFEVYFGNSLSTLCRDEGQAEKTLRTLHGTRIETLWQLTDEEVKVLRQQPPKEAPCES